MGASTCNSRACSLPALATPCAVAPMSCISISDVASLGPFLSERNPCVIGAIGSIGEVSVASHEHAVPSDCSSMFALLISMHVAGWMVMSVADNRLWLSRLCSSTVEPLPESSRTTANGKLSP